MIKLIEDQEEYTNIWQSHSLHVLQHFNWGELKASEGWKIVRAFDDKGAVLQIQTKKLPLLPYSFGYVPKLRSQQMLSDLEEWKAFFKDQDLAFVIFEFAEGNRGKAEELSDTYIHVKPQQSNVVDLTKSEEELFMAMDGKYRRNYKKAIREGVKITVHSEGGKPLNDFYLILEQIFKNTDLLKRNKGYYERLWSLLDQRAHIVLAHKDETCLGAYLLISDNIGCYELYGGVSRSGRDLEAGYALKWEAIKYAKAQGLKTYDHWGVAPILGNGEYDSRHELYQISRFKRGFGGKDIVFPGAKVMVLNKLAYRSFLAAKKLSDWKTSILKRV